MIALPLASKASTVVTHGFGALAAFLVIAAAVATPIALDLWAVVHADRSGIRWRNRIISRRLPWSEVDGFTRGPVSMVLRRVDGREVPLRVLGLRYFGSKKLAVQRLTVLESLRSGREPDR